MLCATQAQVKCSACWACVCVCVCVRTENKPYILTQPIRFSSGPDASDSEVKFQPLFLPLSPFVSLSHSPHFQSLPTIPSSRRLSTSNPQQLLIINMQTAAGPSPKSCSSISPFISTLVVNEARVTWREHFRSSLLQLRAEDLIFSVSV